MGLCLCGHAEGDLGGAQMKACMDQFVRGSVERLLGVGRGRGWWVVGQWVHDGSWLVLWLLWLGLLAVFYLVVALGDDFACIQWCAG